MSDEDRGVEAVKEEAGVEAAVVEEPTATEELAEEPAAVEGPVEAEASVPVEALAEPADAFWTPPVAAPSAETAPAPLAPPRSRTGLIVVVGSIILVLAALVIVGPAAYTALTKGSGAGANAAAPAKTKVTVAIDFMKAYIVGDTMAIKPFLLDATQKAITTEQWAEVAAMDSSSAVVFSPLQWTGDTKAAMTLTAPDATGTLIFTLASAESSTVAMAADVAGSTEVWTVALVPVGSAFRVASLSVGTSTFTFDEAFMQSLISTETPDPTTAP